jgi:signal transduction histidine kinase
VRRSLELRARLARDLHDGVIQSIYAAGLGLESAMSEFDSDRNSARTRLAHCRQSLNGVIREVRGFISGLEPEQMQRHGFAQELSALVSTMQALWPVRIVPKVDPGIAGHLSIQQEVHALQIARECISNALRHGGAKKVLITLTEAAGRGVFTVRDDGAGFDPASVQGQGSGLQNLASRAREMGGTLRINSQPGRGASIVVTFPLQEETGP